MDSEQLKQVILGTVDDDWYGLWEIDWSFNSAGAPNDFPMRSGALEALIRQGTVELRFGRIGAGDLVEIEQAIQAIANPKSWVPPTSREQSVYFVGETHPAWFSLLSDQAAKNSDT